MSEEPKFKPKPGQVDYTNTKRAPVINCVVKYMGTDTIQLDWEAQNYKWISVAEVKSFDLLPGFEKVLGALF